MENPTRLDAMDVMGDVAWSQNHIAAAQESTGKWAVEVCHAGSYRIALRRWPEEFPLKIHEACSGEDAAGLAEYQKMAPKAIRPERASIKLFGDSYELPVKGNEQEIVFDIEVSRRGQTVLEAWFIEGDKKQGAYYVYAEKR